MSPAVCSLTAGYLPTFLRRLHLRTGSGTSGPFGGQNLKLTCYSVNTSNGNGSSKSAFDSVSDEMDTADMGGSDPSVIRDIQQADQNPFPEQEFNGEGDDPLQKLKNQVRSLHRGEKLSLSWTINST